MGLDNAGGFISLARQRTVQENSEHRQSLAGGNSKTTTTRRFGTVAQERVLCVNVLSRADTAFIGLSSRG